MNILYISLDERPCNYKYPAEIIGKSEEVKFIVPPKSLLNKKKIAADIEGLWFFVEENIRNCDYAILSIDMMVYGGLLPSRLHQSTLEELLERLERVKKLKLINPNVKIYAFDTIMRVPSYNSSEEEPDYYESFGESIFRISWLRDKIDKGYGDENDKDEYKKIMSEVPTEFEKDYFGRRMKNYEVTKNVLKLVEEGVIEFLVIPQDDTALYGVQAGEQQEHIKTIKSLDISHKVFIYPGADEVGCTLLSRIINDYNGVTPSVFVRFSSVNGPQIVPSFEDRPYIETIKWHLTSAGLWMVDNSQDADFILMVNTPGAETTGAQTQDLGVRENNSMRNLIEFVTACREYIKRGKKVVISDVAYSNGSDKELINILTKLGVMFNVSGYAGWNTHGNTLGTVLCEGTCAFHYGENKKFIAYRYLEDCGYQSVVRQIVIDELPLQGLSYYDFKDKEEWVKERVIKHLNEFLSRYIQPYLDENIKINGVSFPWRRMFEIDIDLELEE
ncbi:MAG: DUF4127 family protein [Clostridium sp.]|uniref:DUF4127 family protein n=1 Tax=Clostridium paraputrificum TaxID=29363 RepID=A0A6N3CUC4_9CLOT|nr:DUF4127 family protein [Clostridium sp.]MBS5926417.1 DUF4127 family protein [Clostridium sp.]MBS5987549.1 DUF4127 family protein [Clostridium sp.]